MTKIEYPTGVKTKFEYEMNTFENGFNSIKEGDTRYSILNRGGGVRVKQIIDSIDINNYIKRNFVYNINNISSGKLMTRPVFHYTTSGDVVFGTSYPYIPFNQSAAGCEHITNSGYTSYSFINSSNLPMND